MGGFWGGFWVETIIFETATGEGGESPHEAPAEIALTNIREIATHIFVEDDAPLMGASVALPTLQSLSVEIVTQRTLPKISNVVKMVEKYTAHENVGVKRAARSLHSGWATIYKSAVSPHATGEQQVHKAASQG